MKLLAHGVMLMLMSEEVWNFAVIESAEQWQLLSTLSAQVDRKIAIAIITILRTMCLDTQRPRSVTLYGQFVAELL